RGGGGFEVGWGEGEGGGGGGCLGVISWRAVATGVRAQSAPEPTAYEDHLISGGTLKPDISAGDYLTPGDTTGLARSVRIDGVASVLSQQGPIAQPAVHENGIVADAQWETSVYGAWSADMAARIGGGDERFVISG